MENQKCLDGNIGKGNKLHSDCGSAKELLQGTAISLGKIHRLYTLIWHFYCGWAIAKSAEVNPLFLREDIRYSKIGFILYV